jgi:hypothetical protein
MFYKGSGVVHRDTIVKVILNILDKINLPNKIKAFIIKSMHMQAPINGFTLIVLSNFRVGICIYLVFVFVFILFFYFNGCFITIVEYKLDKENFINIADPYLYMTNSELTDENRYYSIIYIGIFYMIVSTWILLYKFKKNY